MSQLHSLYSIDPVIFSNLKHSIAHIRVTYKDVSGVYLIITPDGLYIGSSVDLGGRIAVYYSILTGARKPGSISETKISYYKPEQIGIVFLCFVPPIISLIEEQLAMYVYHPTINTHLKAYLNIHHTHMAHAEGAIQLAQEYQSMFEPGSPEFVRFQEMIDAIKKALNAYNSNPEMFSDTTIGKPVFVYDAITGTLVYLYNSVNSCIKQMHITANTVLSRCEDGLVYKGQYVFSLLPLTVEQVKNALPYVPNVSKKFVIELLNEMGEVVHTFDSLREMCRYYNVSSSKVKTCISKGTK